jgi:hypothetical protein
MRSAAVRRIVEVGRKGWKNTGYHKCSLSETAIFRFKSIIGANLKSCSLANLKTEAVAVHCLNPATALGMPIGVKIV